MFIKLALKTTNAVGSWSDTVKSAWSNLTQHNETAHVLALFFIWVFILTKMCCKLLHNNSACDYLQCDNNKLVN